MAEWRIGRGWSDEELQKRLEHVATLERNFEDDPSELESRSGWYSYKSESTLGRAPTGPPVDDGPFERACAALSRYRFSDTRIVQAYFDDDAELLGRPMVLILRAFRGLRFVTGVRVGAVRHEVGEDETVFGFRYETLQGHIERGAEWFILRKDHASGTVRLRISAFWLPGDFPNWWSRVGFYFVGEHYQRKWHRRAHAYMAHILREPVPAKGAFVFPRRPAHDVVFEKRTRQA